MQDGRTGWMVVTVLAVAAAVGTAAWWARPWAAPAAAEPAGHTHAVRQARPGHDFWADPRLNVDLDAPPARGTAAPAPLAVQRHAAASRGADRWSVENGRLRPGDELRASFDDYLYRRGLKPGEVREALARDVSAAHGPQIAEQVLHLFDGYVRLRDHKWGHPFLLHDRSSWEPALREQQQLRAQVLGPAWAAALYKDEDRAMEMLLMPADAPPLAREEDIALMFPQASASAVAGLQELRRQRLARFGEDVTRRLEQFEAEARDYQARLAEAHTEWARLRSLGYWSDAQRAEAMQAWIDSRFRDDERVKVRILLGLP